ncbi:MAG TPA: hypothetical protein EYQ22_05460 [Gammaproteobacteria bacterium]|nr:hypothetical protein [Gammaproteobacteria bacterium]
MDSEEREQRNAARRDRRANMSPAEWQETMDQRNTLDREHRANMSQAEHQVASQQQNTRRRVAQTARIGAQVKAALNYSPQDFIRPIDIGRMDKVFTHCDALRFQNEPESICCCNGKVKLDPIPDLPPQLRELFLGPRNSHFLQNIRIYNSAFQMTSFGCKEARLPGWNPSFRIQGQLHHRLGSLLPNENEQPKFCQIYVIDSEQQLDARLRYFENMRRPIANTIQTILHASNKYVKSFKTALELYNAHPEPECRAVISAEHRPAGAHQGRYNVPSNSEIAVLMPSEMPNSNRDIVLHKRNDSLQRVKETNKAYDPLQYPLFFPYGTDGWDISMKLKHAVTGEPLLNKKLSPLMYYSHRIMMRRQGLNPLLYGKRLFQQYLVDQGCKVESERMSFLYNNQSLLRSEQYDVYAETARTNEDGGRDIGRPVILPASHTGSPRYMYAKQQDALAYVRAHGKPDLFITCTQDPNSPEISSELFEGQASYDRPDIGVRVFNQLNNVIVGDIKALTHLNGPHRGNPWDR